MSNSKGHPKGLYLVFATGTAERFSYYGMRAIFILFLTQALMMDTQMASSIYGSYTGLVYLTPLLGGYVADKYWGIRRSIFWGAILMGLGQFFMFLSASMLHSDEMSHMLMYTGLGFIIFGNGFFKPTITALVGQLYEPADKRLDAAYTIFYMGVNLGAFFAPLVCGYLGETGNPEDFKWGFLIAAVGIMISLTLFETQKKKYLVSPTGEQIGVEPDARKAKAAADAEEALKEVKTKVVVKSTVGKNLFFIGFGITLFSLFFFAFGADLVSCGIYSACIGIPTYILFDGSLTKIERSRITVIYIIAFFVIFFWSAYEQAGASLTLFAAEQTDRTLFGWEMPASYFQAFNPLFVVVLAYIMPAIWSFLNKRKMEPASPTKQAIGLFLLSLGYLVIAFGVKDIQPGVKTSMMWLTGLYFIHTMGEMSLSPIGLSMVNKLTPARFASLMIGVWYLSMAAANKFAGALSMLYPEQGKVRMLLGVPIASLYDFFMVFVVMSGIASIILFMLSKKLQKMMHGVV